MDIFCNPLSHPPPPPHPITGASRWLLIPTGTLRTSWGYQGLVQNRDRFRGGGGQIDQNRGGSLFWSIYVLLWCPRLKYAQGIIKTVCPCYPQYKRSPSLSIPILVNFLPPPSITPCLGQYIICWWLWCHCTAISILCRPCFGQFIIIWGL